ncbi:hypothetical protein DID88_009774 [Monilinia fructigena]|uniref:Chitin-binding type-1 domain-containing protein n=1 Tax=Monilinia fructigena TaxID=38457 RepID=A0A395IQE7_9HELO|nr:hypothetical protein DID88_009774 [Monilinia fructigena]
MSVNTDPSSSSSSSSFSRSTSIGQGLSSTSSSSRSSSTSSLSSSRSSSSSQLGLGTSSSTLRTSTTLLSSIRTSSSSSISPSSSGLIVSPNGRCGPQGSFYTCQGSANGNCCSRFGFCGIGADWCVTGCNPLYGTCGLAQYSSSSSSISSTVSRSSSASIVGQGSSTSSTARVSTTSSSSSSSSSIARLSGTSSSSSRSSSISAVGQGLSTTSTSRSATLSTSTTLRAAILSSSSTSRVSTSSSNTRALAVTSSGTSTRSTSSASPSASACRSVAAPAVTLALTVTDCCQYYVTKAGDTCANIASGTGILGLDITLLVLLNPLLRCGGPGPQVGVAICVLNINLSIAGSLISPPSSSSVPSSAIATPIPSQAVPSSFFIRAFNSGTGADGTDLMIQQAAEYFAGFNLPYGQQVFSFSYDPATGYLTSGLYILWATASFASPSIKVAPVGYSGWVVPAWPLVCSVDGNLKVLCTANGNVYGKFYLINENGDGNTELAIGNSATTSSIIVAPVDLYLMNAAEEEG